MASNTTEGRHLGGRKHSAVLAKVTESTSESRLALSRLEGRRLCFWYPSTNLSESSASCRYRIGNLTELLRGASAVMERGLPARALRDKSTVVVLRPWVDGARARMLEELRRRGITLIADFDDLLFDCAPDEYPPIVQKLGSRDTHTARLEGFRAAMAYFDAFNVSTEPLVEHVERLRPDAPVHVVPNGLSSSWVAQSQLLYRTWSPGDPKVIRYLSGSPSHDRDFATIREPLKDFLLAHEEVRFEAVGQLRWDTTGFPPHRIGHRSYVPYEQLGELLASSWATLAPLAPSRFNACKSAIKFLEAAALGCPTIATPIADMRRHAAGGVLLAEDASQWYAALTRLLVDDERLECGRRAQSYVTSHAMARDSAQAFQQAQFSWRTAP